MSAKLAKKDSEFFEILGIIRAGRAKAYEAVNVALIDTYWTVGAHLSRKVEEGGWGKGVVKELADWLLTQGPDLKGFSSSNLWRMKQFYEVYRDESKLAPLVRLLPWTHNLLILGQSKRPEEREFYLRLAVQAKWSTRELNRQIRNATFERTVLSDKKLASVMRVLPRDATGIFKDSYLLDFLDLPERHSESDLQSGLLRNLRQFLMELGDGFAFVGEKVRKSGFRTRSPLLSSRPAMSRGIWAECDRSYPAELGSGQGDQPDAQENSRSPRIAIPHR
jgi:predicted nuclease of restriction endonuclease-like (RecB) superfamily